MQLIDGKITYGESARQRKQALEKVKSDVEAAQQQIQDQQRQEASQNAANAAARDNAIRNQKAAAYDSARRNVEAICGRNAGVTITQQSAI